MIQPKFKYQLVTLAFLLTHNFPTSLSIPKNIHVSLSVKEGITRGSCVVCAAKWQKIKAWTGTCPFERGKEVCRTIRHCAHCTTNLRHWKTSYLYKKHFDEFHKKSVFMMSDFRSLIFFSTYTKSHLCIVLRRDLNFLHIYTNK